MFDPAIWAKVPFHFWSAVVFWFGCMVGSHVVTKLGAVAGLPRIGQMKGKR